jgi:hypothetical protein
MNFYEECIKDIDRALVCGYPKNQQLYTLHVRKAKCLKFLGQDYEGCLADAMEVSIAWYSLGINSMIVDVLRQPQIHQFFLAGSHFNCKDSTPVARANYQSTSLILIPDLTTFSNSTKKIKPVSNLNSLVTKKNEF